jgi:transposase
MRPKGTPKQLATRRTQALRLLKRGGGPTEVARQIGVARQTIYEWKASVAGKHHQRSQRGPGRASRLAPQQQKRLARELLRGAYGYGYPDDHWTLDRIGRVIFDQFGIRYQPSGIWYLLRRMKWSSQKPQRTGLRRDDAAIERWKEEEWPRIKKVARPGRDPDSAG